MLIVGLACRGFIKVRNVRESKVSRRCHISDVERTRSNGSVGTASYADVFMTAEVAAAPVIC